MIVWELKKLPYPLSASLKELLQNNLTFYDQRFVLGEDKSVNKLLRP